MQVEDSSDDARLLELAFQRAGITNPIVTVKTGEDALRYFKGEGVYANRAIFPPPRILLLDLKLPGMSGFDVLNSLIMESRLTNVLVVVVSGYAEIFLVRRAYALGAHTFLTKPVHDTDVANLVNAFREYWVKSPMKETQLAAVS